MTGPGIFSYSTTPASNVQTNTGINWDEGMSPAAVNNSARQNMTDARNAFNDLIWFKYGKGDLDYSPVYASGTTFTVAGVDVTSIYHKRRRVKAVGSGTGTIYGSITASAFSTNTTVTVAWDSGSLSNETLTIYISQIPVTGAPVPTGNRLIVATQSPTGTNSASAKMMGLGSSFVLTPASGSIVRFITNGSLALPSQSAGGVIQLRYGTGSAPANGDAATGTAASSGISYENTPVGAVIFPFGFTLYATGLTPGTPYWFDIAISGDGGTVATPTLQQTIIEEVLA